MNGNDRVVGRTSCCEPATRRGKLPAVQADAADATANSADHRVDDGVAERVGADLVGYIDRPAPLEVMRASSDLYMIKTHRQRDADVDESDSAICLVRDGRDALVSWAPQASEAEPGRYEDELRARITVDGHATLDRLFDWVQRPVHVRRDAVAGPPARSGPMEGTQRWLRQHKCGYGRDDSPSAA